MKNILILAMQNAMVSSIAGPMDIFYQAGVMWNYFNGQKIAPYFSIKVVTSTGAPFTCLSGARMVPDGSIHDARDADLVLVSSILDIEKTLDRQGEVIHWLKDIHARGAHIATVCTGAFVLAETGLLDGKTATTHWGYANQFRKRYPRVDFKPERLITDEGDLFCSGGFNAGIDLALYLVEKYCGHKVAMQSSKSAVSDFGRVLQTPYAVFRFQKDHRDERILAAQEWMENNFEKNVTYNELARNHGMSRRTFERRFKSATGDTPLTYQQRIRVEAAKHLLEEGALSFDEITWRVGYEDSSTFRKVFHKQAGLRPAEYRKAFCRR